MSQTKCPNCGSFDVSKESGGSMITGVILLIIVAFILILFLGAPSVFWIVISAFVLIFGIVGLIEGIKQKNSGEIEYTCHSCKYKWKRGKEFDVICPHCKKKVKITDYGVEYVCPYCNGSFIMNKTE